MLVVTRRTGEAIMIGDGIEIRVVRVSKDEVRLGITAAADVTVHRLEVYEEIRRENRAAALPDAGHQPKRASSFVPVQKHG